MRIVSGKHKGRKINPPVNLPVRPTTDRAKEALFSIIDSRYYFQEKNLLDLFSGTGNISFEFASRGCEKITAVDTHYACVKYISETSKQLDFTIDTLKADVYKFLEKSPAKATVIFADPPYDFDQEKFQKIIDLVFNNNLLEDDGVLIIEHSSRTDLSENQNYNYSKKYGGNMFSFFEKEELQ